MVKQQNIILPTVATIIDSELIVKSIIYQKLTSIIITKITSKININKSVK